jgi:hypothetical protein
VRVLYDAKRIDPEVWDVQPTASDDSVAETSREFFHGDFSSELALFVGV